MGGFRDVESFRKLRRTPRLGAFSESSQPPESIPGRLANVTVQPSGETSLYGYDPLTGNLVSITGPDADLAFTYDGDLLLSETWNWGGGLTTTVSRGYDDFLQMTELQVDALAATAFAHDDDGLVVQAGDLNVARRPADGLLAGTSLGVVEDAWSFSDFAEIAGYTAEISGLPIFEVAYERDALGRIVVKNEVVDGQAKEYVYAYDPAGRLWRVEEDGVLVAEYSYDPNGNRLELWASGTTTAGTYDDQDRLLSYGATTYTYGANGELATATTGSDTTMYTYDARGNLRSVTLPDSTEIEYLVDGRSRRIGRKVNGVIERRWVYQDQLNPVAELNAAGEVLAEFVYATKTNVPDVMTTYSGGVQVATYRIVSDHLGSVRLVIDTTTGAIAQRLDYDEFGQVLLDTNPGFQPFAFAGGIYDPATGLVRFGARDYDSRTGRWTAKDPIGFSGGDTYLYSYASGEPINRLDPSGLRTTILIIRDAGIGTHAAVYIDRGIDGLPTLYDPAGSYVPENASHRGSDDVFLGPDANSCDYSKYHRKRGGTIEAYTFNTSAADEAAIAANIELAKSSMPFFCAVNVCAVISGIGPFDGLTALTPGTLARELRKLQ